MKIHQVPEYKTTTMTPHRFRQRTIPNQVPLVKNFRFSNWLNHPTRLGFFSQVYVFQLITQFSFPSYPTLEIP